MEEREAVGTGDLGKLGGAESWGLPEDSGWTGEAETDVQVQDIGTGAILEEGSQGSKYNWQYVVLVARIPAIRTVNRKRMKNLEGRQMDGCVSFQCYTVALTNRPVQELFIFNSLRNCAFMQLFLWFIGVQILKWTC